MRITHSLKWLVVLSTLVSLVIIQKDLGTVLAQAPQPNLPTLSLESRDSIDELFSDSKTQESSSISPLSLEQGPQIRRKRLVNVRFDRLANIQLFGEPNVGNSLSSNVSPQIKLNLFNDVALGFEISKKISNQDGSTSLIGKIEGVPLSQVTITYKANRLYGSVVSLVGVYEIMGVDGDTHVIYDVDQSKFGGDEVVTVKSSSLSESQIHNAEYDDGSIIDVLVAYTTNLRVAERGQVGAELLINNAVNSTNTSYQNSSINSRLRLVGAIEVNYGETGNSRTDLDNLRDGKAGLQIVRLLRDALAADLVVLIVEGPLTDGSGKGACGEAYEIMGEVSATFEQNAYVVANKSCVNSNFTFAHELGHLMGARHDWYVDDTNNEPYSYNHGHVIIDSVNPANSWRTVMAYPDKCKALGITPCNRVNLWSDGSTNGVKAGTSTSCSEGNKNNPNCDADNRLAISNTALTVSKFRLGNFTDVYVSTTCTIIEGPLCVQTGTDTYPFVTFAKGVFRAAPSTTVWVKPGNYPETLLLVEKNPRGLIIDRPMTIRATSGIAIIGQ